MEAIVEIQKELKAPKNQFNAFGKYKYRNAEDIIEAVKPLLHARGYWLTLSDEPVELGGRVYIRSEAIISNGEKTYSAVAYAREDESKKGMDGAQVTGAASSYARKYALNGLLAIDDSKDADVQNKEEKSVEKPYLTQEMPEWAKSIEWLKKGGDIELIFGKYQLTQDDEKELRRFVLPS